jgi:hypothetical protein
VESSRKTASLSHCVTFPEDHSEHARGWNDCANRIESKLRALLPAKEERRDA